MTAPFVRYFVRYEFPDGAKVDKDLPEVDRETDRQRALLLEIEKRASRARVATNRANASGSRLTDAQRKYHRRMIRKLGKLTLADEAAAEKYGISARTFARDRTASGIHGRRR